MSIRVMTEVWQMALPASEKIVLLALADCANDEGHCWPSMRTLAIKCSKTDRTVQAAIKSLVEAGHLTRREVPGRGCNYTVHPGGGRNGCAPAGSSPPKGAPPPESSPAQKKARTPEAVSDKPSGTVTTKVARRLPDDFAMPDDWKAWAREAKGWTDADADEEAAQFADYWQARGANAAHLDWRKTWQVWVRRSRRRAGAAPAGAGAAKRPVDMDDYRRRLAAIDARMGRGADGYAMPVTRDHARAAPENGEAAARTGESMSGAARPFTD